MAQGVRPIDKEKFYKGLDEVLAGTKSMGKSLSRFLNLL